MSAGLNPRARAVLGIELHTRTPDALVPFYERTLGVAFEQTTYPLRRYYAEIGRFALIISDASASESERVTLDVLVNDVPAGEGQRYFAPPRRPLAGEWPERFAQRLRDPEGNHVALMTSMDHVVGRTSSITSWAALTEAATELARITAQDVRARLVNKLRGQVNRFEWLTDRSTILHRDLSGYTHLVASRDGLFAINRTSFARVLRGQFFGVTVKDGDIYVFQSCGGGRANRGRIVALTIARDRIQSTRVVAAGLHDACHQIDFVGDDLLVVDCDNARILQIRPGKAEPIAHYPLGQLPWDVARRDVHMNSLARHPDGTLWVLLNNGKRYSEVIVLDETFAIVRRFRVDAGAAHNITFTLDDDEYLIADSLGGRLVSARGAVAHGDQMLLRGIALDDRTCVVGESFYATRPFRNFVPGRVHFFERGSWVRTHSISLPAAPTDIRRIDGQDYSIGNYLMTRVKPAVERQPLVAHL